MNFKKNTDFFVGAKLALKSAQMHFKTAELSKAISAGIANSHLILAAEEAIKASFLYKVSHNRDWLKHGGKKYFSNHGFKHIKMQENERFNNLIKALCEELFEPISRLQEEEDANEEKSNFLHTLEHNPMMLWRRIKATARNKSINKEWYENANRQKNRGFYLNYDEVSGSWSEPSTVREEELEQSLNIVSGLLQEVKTQIKCE